jgi:hypothetical protein
MEMQVSQIDNDQARKKRNAFWAFLRATKREFDSIDTGETGFVEYILTLYGIECIMDNGQYTEHYIIRDKEKFFLAKLKGLI